MSTRRGKRKNKRPAREVIAEWVKLAKKGRSDASIARRFPPFTVNQVEYWRGRFLDEYQVPPVRPPPAFGSTPDLGYLYVLTNSSLPGLLKIGKTARDPHERARQLSSTGLPAPFEVAWVSHPLSGVAEAEAVAHEVFGEHREQGNREFFRAEIRWAVSHLTRIEKRFRLC